MGTTKKELIEALENDTFYDFISNNYLALEKFELLEIIKEYSYFIYKKGFKDREVLNDLYENEWTIEDILEYKEQVLTEEMFDIICEHEDVERVEDNGSSGRFVGKNWYTVVFFNKNIEDIDVYY